VVEGVSERRVDCGQENAGCGRMECVDGLEGLPARSLGGGSGVTTSPPTSVLRSP
jgi:hypothetical protein